MRLPPSTTKSTKRPLTACDLVRLKRPKIIKNRGPISSQTEILTYFTYHRVSTIIIESRELSYKIRNYFHITDWFHKGSILSGFSAIALNLKFGKSKISLFLGIVSATLAYIYNKDWCRDDLSKYRVLKEDQKLDRLDLKSIDMSNVKSTTPTVIVKVDENIGETDNARVKLHTWISFLSLFWPVFFKSFYARWRVGIF